MHSVMRILVNVIIELLFLCLLPAIGLKLSERKTKYPVTQLRPLGQNFPVFRQGPAGGEAQLAIGPPATISCIEESANTVFGLKRGFELGTAKVSLILQCRLALHQYLEFFPYSGRRQIWRSDGKDGLNERWVIQKYAGNNHPTPGYKFL